MENIRNVHDIIPSFIIKGKDLEELISIRLNTEYDDDWINVFFYNGTRSVCQFKNETDLTESEDVRVNAKLVGEIYEFVKANGGDRFVEALLYKEDKISDLVNSEMDDY